MAAVARHHMKRRPSWVVDDADLLDNVYNNKRYLSEKMASDLSSLNISSPIPYASPPHINLAGRSGPAVLAPTKGSKHMSYSNEIQASPAVARTLFPTSASSTAEVAPMSEVEDMDSQIEHSVDEESSRGKEITLWQPNPLLSPPIPRDSLPPLSSVMNPGTDYELARRLHQSQYDQYPNFSNAKNDEDASMMVDDASPNQGSPPLLLGWPYS